MPGTRFYRFTLANLQAAVVVMAMLFSTATALAGGGPENVLLVVNDQSASSRLLANLYIDGRDIPPTNVLYLNDVPNKDLIALDDFRDRILKPVLDTIASRRQVGTIDYIIYSSGFPTRVSIKEHADLFRKGQGQALPGKYFAPVGSLTSMTYFASSVLSDDPGYMWLRSNLYYRAPLSSVLKTPFGGPLLEEYQSAVATIESANLNPESPETGSVRIESAEFKAARDSLKQMADNHPGQAAVLYQMARVAAIQDKPEQSIKWLTRAIAMGWTDRDFIQSDTKLVSMRANPLFKGLVERIDNATPLIQSHGFRNAYHWGPNGLINGVKQGQRYFLSAMLSVTRGQGLSDDVSMDYLVRSINADNTQPIGGVYFTLTGDVRTTARKPNFAVAVDALRSMGIEARVLEQKLPERRDNVIGLTCGTANFNWPATGSKFLPGAIADNLTSTGGLMPNKGQTKMTEFLRAGAAGASGTVVEPYSFQEKFPHPMIHVHYARGCSLAESFYQSVYGPYQQLLVGDALCQPYAVKPTIKISSPRPMETISGSFELTMDQSGSPVDTAGIEIFIDGMMVLRSRAGSSVKLNTVGTPDGYHEIRVVVVGRDSIETRGRAVVPLMFNNDQREVTLSTNAETYKETDNIVVTAKSNFGQRIVIQQNRKTVGVISANEGSVEVSAASLGVGNVALSALAYEGDGDAAAVQSAPMKLTIEGRIAKAPEK